MSKRTIDFGNRRWATGLSLRIAALCTILVFFCSAPASLAAPGGHGNKGGNGNGGTGTSNQIIGTDGDDGGRYCDGGNNGSDPLEGSTNVDDFIKGLDGDDCLIGLGGDDTLQGGAGDDWLQGREDNDVLSPGPSATAGGDLAEAGPGDDRILGGASGTIDGGAGFDWVSYNTDQMQLIVNLRNPGNPVYVTIDTIQYEVDGGTIKDVIGGGEDTVMNVEKVTGTANDDYYFGNDAVDEFFGGGRGDDYFDAGGGDDFIGADRGDDLLIGGPGNDQLRGAENADEFRFSSNDFMASEEDIIEDFNGSADCINLTDLDVYDINFEARPGAGKAGKADSVITLSYEANIVGTIVVWDVRLSVSDLGCP